MSQRFKNDTYQPIYQNLPSRTHVPLKEDLVEFVSIKGLKTECHFIKYAHSLVEPAIKVENGDEYWYKNGVLHRQGGPAVSHGGDRLWYKDGTLHREDGPAIERTNGVLEWFMDNKRHRIDGPAVIDHKHGNQYWIDGIKQMNMDNTN